MKKTSGITALLSAALLLTVGSTSYAAQNSFVDLDKVPQKIYIEGLAQKGVVHGMPNAHFKPNQQITLAEGMTMITQAFHLETFKDAEDASKSAPELQANSWYAEYVSIAAAKGMALPEKFVASTKLNKEDFVYHLVRAMEITGGFPLIKLIPIDIADEKQMTPAYQGSIQRALHYKLIELDSKGNVNPKAKLTRAEAAEILYKASVLYDKMLTINKANGQPASEGGRWMYLPEGVTPADNE
ncbi:S-layer homology domain-containing protein [Paenibacillus gansuensis]|uniref:S-layer homology domain-containing protein n=1 Tax=Paenibacillus gansuensis TaxID=306542 RepID=A0ABW5PH76_9BACL